LTNVDLLVWKVLGFNVENVITQGWKWMKPWQWE
jgi:hypothetical protein